MHDWVKHRRQHVILSRTPLPRNVIAYYVHAPRHGAMGSNAEILKWLEREADRLLRRKGNRAERATGHVQHYWMFDDRPSSLTWWTRLNIELQKGATTVSSACRNLPAAARAVEDERPKPRAKRSQPRLGLLIL